MWHQKQTLSGGISLEDLANAFTDPNKRLNFPIKPIETKIIFDPLAIATIIGAASILAIGISKINTGKRKA